MIRQPVLVFASFCVKLVKSTKDRLEVDLIPVFTYEQFRKINNEYMNEISLRKQNESTV